MTNLSSNPTLPELQKFISQLELERGWDKDTLLQKCLMLGEEVGELFRAVRKVSVGLPTDPKSPIADPAEELADILILICFIANRMGIDLEDALRMKDEENKSRHWS